jgi:hypothetical protein
VTHSQPLSQKQLSGKRFFSFRQANGEGNFHALRLVSTSPTQREVAYVPKKLPTRASKVYVELTTWTAGQRWYRINLPKHW